MIHCTSAETVQRSYSSFSGASNIAKGGAEKGDVPKTEANSTILRASKAGRTTERTAVHRNSANFFEYRDRRADHNPPYRNRWPSFAEALRKANFWEVLVRRSPSCCQELETPRCDPGQLCRGKILIFHVALITFV